MKIKINYGKTYKNSCETINFIRYNLEGLLRCYKEAEKEDYERYEEEYEILVLQTLNRMKEQPNRIRLVMIDEEYFKFTLKKGRNDAKEHFLSDKEIIEQWDTEENRINYINSLSDKEVEKLWRKHNMDKRIGFYFLPLQIYSSKNPLGPYNYPITNNIKTDVTELLAKNIDINKTDIIIANELCTPDDFQKSYEQYFYAIQEGFCKGVYTFTNIKPCLMSKQTEENKPDYEVRILPVGIRKKSPCILNPRKYIFCDEEIRLKIPEEATKALGKKLMNALGYNFSYSPCLVPADEIEDFTKIS